MSQILRFQRLLLIFVHTDVNVPIGKLTFNCFMNDLVDAQVLPNVTYLREGCCGGHIKNGDDGRTSVIDEDLFW